MADREISIVLRAKNAMAAGLSKAGKSLRAFGQSALRIGGFFAKSFLAAGTAVAGFAAKAIAAYSAQESAERAMAGALNAQGEAGDALLPSLKRIASAIQDETGADDDAVLAGMAKMRMLGVQTSKLGEAAKATIALKSIGLEEAAAQKAVAMAMQGSYEMLNRYVPALRTATSEEEKAAIVNELFRKGYEQQADQLDTVAGQWSLLKGRVGDVWEELGAAIAQNDQLMGSLKAAGEAVKRFGENVALWVEGGGMVRLVAGVKLFYVDVKKQFELIGNSARVTWAAVSDGVDSAVTYSKNLFGAFGDYVVARFRYMVDYAAAAWEKIKSPFSTFTPPSTAAYEQALDKIKDAALGKDALVTKRTEAALAARYAIQSEHAAAVEKIAAEQAAAQIAHEDRVAKAKAAAAKAEAQAAGQTTRTVKKESISRAKAAIANLKSELAAIQKNKAAVEALAVQRVNDIIAQRREQKGLERELGKEAARAKELTNREGRRVRLSGKDREWLKAFRDIESAKKQAKDLAGAEQSVEWQISAAEQALSVAEETRDGIEELNKKMDDVLSYPG
jgi:hypothetical protein